MSRLKSPVFWIGIVSIFYILAGNYGLYDFIGITEESVRMIIDIIMGIFGIVAIGNNPTDPNSY